MAENGKRLGVLECPGLGQGGSGRSSVLLRPSVSADSVEFDDGLLGQL
jgi:hypothetical protein